MIWVFVMSNIIGGLLINTPEFEKVGLFTLTVVLWTGLTYTPENTFNI